MKALSLWQPWATLFALGIKRAETRSWSTRYRGPLVIHAAKRKPTIEDLECIPHEVLAQLARRGITSAGALPLGAYLATTELLDVQPIGRGARRRLAAKNPLEMQMGDWSPGRFAWLAGRRRQLTPIPGPGRQGLFDPPDDLMAQEPAHVRDGELVIPLPPLPPEFDGVFGSGQGRRRPAR